MKGVTASRLALPPPPSALPLPQLRQRRPEVPPIPRGTHPARRALNPRELAGGEKQELVRLARPASHTDPVAARLDGAHSTHAPIRHPHTITDVKAAAHQRQKYPITREITSTTGLASPDSKCYDEGMLAGRNRWTSLECFWVRRHSSRSCWRR